MLDARLGALEPPLDAPVLLRVARLAVRAIATGRLPLRGRARRLLRHAGPPHPLGRCTRERTRERDPTARGPVPQGSIMSHGLRASARNRVGWLRPRLEVPPTAPALQVTFLLCARHSSSDREPSPA